MKMGSDVPRRAALSMILGALAATRSFATGVDLSPEEFRDLVVAIGKRRYPSLPLRAAGQLDVLWGPHHLYLSNAYAGIRPLPPQQREAAILDFLSRFSPDADARTDKLVADAESWEKARTLLRPKILPTETVLRAPRVVHQDFTSDVVIGYGIDLGDKDLYVDQRRLAKWGVSSAEVHAIAIANLEAMSTGLPTAHHLAVGKGQFVVVSTNDGYDAARLLLPGMRTRLLSALGPNARAGIPGRDLFVVWSRSLERHAEVEAMVRDWALRMPHRLTGEIFAVDKDGVRLA